MTISHPPQSPVTGAGSAGGREVLNLDEIAALVRADPEFQASAAKAGEAYDRAKAKGVARAEALEAAAEALETRAKALRSQAMDAYDAAREAGRRASRHVESAAWDRAERRIRKATQP